MTKLEQAARQALEALEKHQSILWLTNNKQDTEAITALREALDHSGEATDMAGCSYCNNPLFAGRKCDNCGREAEQSAQEPFDMDDHPPHRLCECRKCMEYFTPLPDCDAFAASGKPIAEQTNTQLMEGFRPVSEMIAEHKQDPKKAAAIEKAKMRKAERKPVAWMNKDEIIRMARDAGSIDSEDVILTVYAAFAAHEKKFWIEQIEVECNEAVLAEREACAKLCEDIFETSPEPENYADTCAAAIRSRSKHG